MLKLIGAAALKDSIGMLKSEKDFFQKDASARKTAMEAKLPGYPKSFVDYMARVSEEQFLAETKEAIQVFGGFARAEQLGLLEAIAVYISEDLGVALDKLNSAFFFMKLDERERKLEELFPGHTSLVTTVRAMFSESTYQEVTAMATSALTTIKEVPVVVIQTPLELPSSERAKIRTEFNAKHPGSFAEFQTNPQIIGGMRVFINGDVADHSWLAKIHAITSISS